MNKFLIAMSFFETNQFYAIVGVLLFLLRVIVTAFEIRSLIRNKQGITPSDIKILWSGIGFSVLGAVVFLTMYDHSVALS